MQRVSSRVDPFLHEAVYPDLPLLGLSEHSRREDGVHDPGPLVVAEVSLFVLGAQESARKDSYITT